jgi:primosomal protein N' (replication factor Y)
MDMEEVSENAKKISVLQVIPIARGIGKETLSYFTTEDVPPGSLIDVSVRKKKIKGIVVSSEDAGKMRAVLREAHFSLKKIEKVAAKRFLSADFMNAAIKTAEYFAGTTGATLNSIIPKHILDSLEKFSNSPLRISQKKSANKNQIVKKLHVIQTNYNSRMEAYFRAVKSQFSTGHSVFIMVPTVEQALTLEKNFEGMISEKNFTLYSSLAKKKLLERSLNYLSEKGPVLVIATGGFLSLPRSDLGAIIIEQESSRAYKARIRPFVDFRNVAEFFASTSSTELILGDELLRAETIVRFQDELSLPLKDALEYPSIQNLKLVDMKIPKEKIDLIPKSKRFRVLSEELERLIASAIELNQKIVLFASRKGYASTIVCKDCGQSVLCNTCSAPVVLHKSKKEDGNFFLCHHCGEKRTALEGCKRCGSWNLDSFGIGIERIQEEIAAKFPNLNIYILDRSIATTNKQAKDIIQEFLGVGKKDRAAVLIGTEAMLTFLHQPVDHTAIVSMDSLFAIPDFRINERIAHLVLNISRLAGKSCIVQSRNVEHPVLQAVSHDALRDFFATELKQRKQLGYPPFKILIKVSLKGKKDFIRDQAERMKMFFNSYRAFVFPALISTIKNEYIMNVLLKIDPGSWPDTELIEILRSLSPQYAVQIDPESIL